MSVSQLSEHFSISEFTKSQVATRMGRPIFIEPGSQVEQNLKELCVHVLEPLRTAVGKPIHISSGYRPDWLNKIIGGSPRSQHQLGQAGDFEIPGMSLEDIAKAVLNNDIEFDQMILEFGEWVHLSYVFGHNRNEVLRAYKENGKTKYQRLTKADLVEGYFA